MNRIIIAVLILFCAGILNAQQSLTIRYKVYRINADSTHTGAGVDIQLSIKDNQSFTYYPSIGHKKGKLPLGSELIPKSTYCNPSQKLLLDLYGYKGEPRTHALIVMNFPEEWKITGEKKVIMGDTCIRAETVIAGIKKVVYYSPEKPAGFGCHGDVGLPGTVLEAGMPDRNIWITAVQIEKSSPDIVEPTFARRVSEKTYRQRRESTGNPKIVWREKDFIN